MPFDDAVTVFRDVAFFGGEAIASTHRSEALITAKSEAANRLSKGRKVVYAVPESTQSFRG